MSKTDQSMILTVTARYGDAERDVICRDDAGNTYIVDFFTDGALPEEYANIRMLIGKRIKVAYLQPYTFIASEPSILEAGQ